MRDSRSPPRGSRGESDLTFQRDLELLRWAPGGWGGAERGRGGARAGLCGDLPSRPRLSPARVECGIREGRVGVRVLEGVTVRWMGKNRVWRLFRGQAAMKGLRGWRALPPEYDWRLRPGGLSRPVASLSAALQPEASGVAARLECRGRSRVKRSE